MPHERKEYAELLLEQARDRSRIARDELAMAAVDLFLPRDRRLTDQQRALTTDLLVKLITEVEFEIRQYLVESLLHARGRPTELEAALGDEAVRVAMPAIESGELVRERALLTLFMQRTEEHLIAVSANGDDIIAPTSAGLVEGLARNPDAETARRAVAYVVAQAKRRDRFQEPVLPRDEIPADLVYRLYWHIAAALRRHLLRSHVIEPTELDRAVEDAVRRAMAEHGEGQGLPRRAVRLAARLNELGELGDAFLAQALAEGHPMLTAAGLSVRAAVGLDVIWQALLDRGRHSLLVLARAVGMDRDAVASIVATLDAVHPLVRSPAATKAMLAAYADIDTAGAQRVLRAWQLDPGYRDAIDELG